MILVVSYKDGVEAEYEVPESVEEAIEELVNVSTNYGDEYSCVLYVATKDLKYKYPSLHKQLLTEWEDFETITSWGCTYEELKASQLLGLKLENFDELSRDATKLEIRSKL